MKTQNLPVAFVDRLPTSADIPFAAYFTDGKPKHPCTGWVLFHEGDRETVDVPDWASSYAHFLVGAIERPTKTPAELLVEAQPPKPALHDPRWKTIRSRADWPPVGVAIWVDVSAVYGGSQSPFRCGEVTDYNEHLNSSWSDGARWILVSVVGQPIPMSDHEPTAGKAVWAWDSAQMCGVKGWKFFEPACVGIAGWHSDFTHWLPGDESQKPSVIPAAEAPTPPKVFCRSEDQLCDGPVEIPAGYVELENGTVIAGTDKYWLENEAVWKLRSSWKLGSVGKPYNTEIHFPTIRAVEIGEAPEVTIPSGWRRLGLDEKIVKGDCSWHEGDEGCPDVEAYCAITDGYTVAQALANGYSPGTIFVRRLGESPKICVQDVCPKAPEYVSGIPTVAQLEQQFDLITSGTILKGDWLTWPDGETEAANGYIGATAREGHNFRTFRARPSVKKPRSPEGTPPAGYRWLVEGDVVSSGDRIFDRRNASLSDPLVFGGLYQGHVVENTSSDLEHYPFVGFLVDTSAQDAKDYSRDREKEIEQLRTQVANLQRKNERQRAANRELEERIIEAGKENGAMFRELQDAKAQLRSAEEAYESRSKLHREELADVKEQLRIADSVRGCSFLYNSGPENEHVLMTTERPNSFPGLQFLQRIFVPQQKLNDANATITTLKRQNDNLAGLLIENQRADAELASLREYRDHGRERSRIVLGSLPLDEQVGINATEPSDVSGVSRARLIAKYITGLRQRIVTFEAHQLKWHELFHAATELHKAIEKYCPPGTHILSARVGDFMEHKFSLTPLFEALYKCSRASEPTESPSEPKVYSCDVATCFPGVQSSNRWVREEALAEAQKELSDFKAQLRKALEPVTSDFDILLAVPVGRSTQIISDVQKVGMLVSYWKADAITAFKKKLRAALQDWKSYDPNSDKDLIEITADVVEECEQPRELNQNQRDAFVQLRHLVGADPKSAEVDTIFDACSALVILRDAAAEYRDSGWSHIAELNLDGALMRCRRVNPKVLPFTPVEKVAA